MKMKSFLIPALALALAGCANEELETIGSGTIPAVPSGHCPKISRIPDFYYKLPKLRTGCRPVRWDGRK